MQKYTYLACIIITVLIGSRSPRLQAYEELHLAIIDTNVSGQVAGETLSIAKHLNIPEGQYMRVITPSGDIVDIVGPHQGPAKTVISSIKKPLPKKFFEDLWTAIYGQGKSSKAMGATRSINIGNPPTKYHRNNLEIDGGQRIRVCIENKQKLLLSRTHNPSHEIQLRISPQGAPEKVYQWPIDEQFFTIPNNILSNHPSKIVFSLGQQGDLTHVRLTYGNPQTVGQQLLWFQQNGCKIQLEDAMQYYKDS